MNDSLSFRTIFSLFFSTFSRSIFPFIFSIIFQLSFLCHLMILPISYYNSFAPLSTIFFWIHFYITRNYFLIPCLQHLYKLPYLHLQIFYTSTIVDFSCDLIVHLLSHCIHPWHHIRQYTFN